MTTLVGAVTQLHEMHQKDFPCTSSTTAQRCLLIEASVIIGQYINDMSSRVDMVKDDKIKAEWTQMREHLEELCEELLESAGNQ